MEDIPRSHPRYWSLVTRQKLVDAMKEGVVVPQGLISHGRGEAFDYILGEKSLDFAIEAERAAVAAMLLARRPIISVNGNYAALAADDIVKLSEQLNAPIEVNVFHRTEERVKAIEDFMKRHGATRVYGSECQKTHISGLESARGIVCVDGIYSADVVLVAIEDGDRTEALRRMGKVVIAIDLNPFSRTAQAASITIVDEAIRATKNMISMAEELKGLGKDKLRDMVSSYSNRRTLSMAFKAMLERLEYASSKGIIIDLGFRDEVNV
ncbi:4-phosphopantoate--beta-alanine ligase [Acidilobus sp.]|jgi:4-phosphopantoate--beta-alanine ligase|uniref:4-phosphopantoate--beta-alanine ligase n=1 Tax=Acidilobus sp. TaxID=1872109 RepID=UPI003D0680FC